jgi:hypothetical protein
MQGWMQDLTRKMEKESAQTIKNMVGEKEENGFSEVASV